MVWILPLPAPGFHRGPLRGFGCRICQMRVRVSTNRAGWQMRGESSPKAAPSCKFSRKTGVWLDSRRTALNHNQKLRTAHAAALPFVV
jgi:hypothetical protein